jgi:Peptidase family M50
LGVLLFILAITVVIAIHELGHLVTAKIFKFKATQYFIGFGPTLWSTRRGETEYGVKALPVGGFVKIVGMNPCRRIGYTLGGCLSLARIRVDGNRLSDRRRQHDDRIRYFHHRRRAYPCG